MKIIEVTDSFLTLKKMARGCQKESKEDCSTNKYISSLIKECQCLPFQLKFLDEVTQHKKNNFEQKTNFSINYNVLDNSTLVCSR